MAMIKDPRCPKCGGEILIDDYDDYEMDSEMSVEFQVYGHCEDYNARYRWTEVHQYVGLKCLEETD